MKIVCICDDGVQTSVACARMISYILRNKAWGARHMQEQAWIAAGDCDGHCEDCTSRPCNPAKQAALEACDELWTALFKPSPFYTEDVKEEPDDADCS